jgi:branched-chain amino acid transport system substrate-binding protein
VAIAACGSSNSTGGGGGGKTPSTITIGATLPLTGPGGAYGTYMRDGLQMAINQINASGGVHGAKLKLNAMDDQAQANLAVSDTRQLLSNGVVAIASAYSAPPLAQRPMAARQQVPVFNGGSFDPVFQNLPYLFSDLLMSTQTEPPELQYAKHKLGVKKVAILFETDASAYDLKVTPPLVKQVFGTTPAIATVDQTATSVVPQVQKLLATHPDMLYLYMDGNIASLTYKALGQLNVKIPTFGDEATTEVPEVANTPGISIYGVEDTLTPASSFTKAYNANPTYKSQQPPNVFVSRYYSIVQTIAQALDKAISEGKPANGASLNSILKSGFTVQGADGPMTYSSTGALASGKVQVIKIEKGKPVQVASYPSAPAS